MDLALYCPDYGFYEKEADKVGRTGDFFTNVSVGSLFGELVAFQISDWLIKIEGRVARLDLVEAGAYDGRLAGDILGWLRERRPDQYQKVQYWVVEPSSRLGARQRRTLEAFGSKVRWVRSLSELGEGGGVNGVILSNELLDAMPARRFSWSEPQREWWEWGVAEGAGGFSWVKLGRVEFDQTGVPPELGRVLPDGYTVERCAAAETWWNEAARILSSGRLLTVDYGALQEELLAPERNQGTLRTYERHRVGQDLLARPGEQDITAHVNFSAIRSVGETAGLHTELYGSQERFLMSIAGRALQNPDRFGEWCDSKRRQLQTLVHPEHMGRPFKVLIQSRGD